MNEFQTAAELGLAIRVKKTGPSFMISKKGIDGQYRSHLKKQSVTAMYTFFNNYLGSQERKWIEFHNNSSELNIEFFSN